MKKPWIVHHEVELTLTDEGGNDLAAFKFAVDVCVMPEQARTRDAEGHAAYAEIMGFNILAGKLTIEAADAWLHLWLDANSDSLIAEAYEADECEQCEAADYQRDRDDERHMFGEL